MGKKSENHTYTKRIKAEIIQLGADLVGVADVEPLKQLNLTPPDLLDSFNRAISIAIKLPRAVFEQIVDRPTPIYSYVYRTANRILDEIAFRTASIFQKDGFNSLPIPASQIVDEENWYGAITHKAVGRMAGLGWLGKSLLLVNPQYGPRIRLVTLLTDALLTVDGPIENRCGECTLCRDACPVGAIKGVNTEDYYKSRDDALYFSRCVEKLVGEFSKLPNIRSPICGICIKVCPFGR
nr:epoxyqueuosine reductase [Desulfobacterales bacterium]